MPCTWGPRNDPCLARPVPFWFQGFLPVPLTSLIVFVEWVPCWQKSMRKQVTFRWENLIANKFRFILKYKLYIQSILCWSRLLLLDAMIDKIYKGKRKRLMTQVSKRSEAEGETEYVCSILLRWHPWHVGAREEEWGMCKLI